MVEEPTYQPYSDTWPIWVAVVVVIVGLFIYIGARSEKQYFDSQKGRVKKSKKAVNSRPLVGFFKLPADGSIVTKDVAEREFWLLNGDKLKFTQCTSPIGKFSFINKNIPSLIIDETEYTSSRLFGGKKSGRKIEMKSDCARDLMIKVEIFPQKRRR